MSDPQPETQSHICPTPYGGKIPLEYTDQISGWYYQVSNYLEPTLYYWQITPNMVTLFRMGLIVLSVYLMPVYSGFAALMVSISYFLDCLDGHYARRYRLVSSIGDYLDHGADILSWSLLSWHLLPALWNGEHYLLFATLGLLTFTTIIQTSCEERYLEEKKASKALMNKVEEPVCDSLNIIRWTSNPEINLLLSESCQTNLINFRWLGAGTLFLYLSFLVWYYPSL